ncbi:mucin-17-like [Gopherus evgoodei]|uniref:mucin-17-like n=1 Tax=Gopherus evgoodei TaxID=1825980 RepID=UPI0011CF9AB1|nr:mucin-17-like [Gopherus evgoodei]
MGSTRSDTTDTESNSPPALTNKVSSTASAAAELGDKTTTFVGTNTVTHLSTTGETPAEISSNSPATTGFSTVTTLPLSTRSTRDGPATLNPLETESSTSSSSSPVSKSDSQASEQTASNAVSGHRSTVPRNGRTEETSSTPSATVTESSLGITSTKGALSPVTSEVSTQGDITTSSNKPTSNDVTARDRSHSSLHSTAAETPSTDRETSVLPVSIVVLDSSTVAPTATSLLTTNIPPQTEVSLITGSSNTVPKTVPMGSTRSDTTDTESNSPPALTNKVSSTASAAAELGDKSTTFVGTNPVTHLSTTGETPAEISSNSPATTGFSTETTLPLSTRSTRDGPATLNPLETESSTSSSSSPVSKSDSQASEQTASNAVSGHGSTVTRNGRTEETSSTPSATVTESSLGITSTKGALSPVTSELNTQEDITTSSNQGTLNDVTARDRSHSSLHSTAAEIPSTDRETSALPVSTVILDSSIVAPTATSRLTTNIPPQTKDSLITGSSNTVPKTVPMGSTRSDTTDTESNSPPALTNKVSSTASAAAELGDKSTTFVGTNPVTHLSTTGETPAEISSNSPATTGFSTETTLPLSTRSTRDGPATLNPLETESSTSSSSSPVSKSDSQASEQTASNAVSGHGSTVTRNGRTEETSSTPSATVTESSLGITSTKGALSPVTSELNTQEDITTSSNERTLNDVTAGDRSHSSLHSTAAETPSTDRETSALSVSTVILDSSTVAPTATSRLTTNIPPQTEFSLITGSSNTVPKTVPMGSTRSDTTDTESNSPPALTNKVSSTASAAAELGDKSTTFVGTNPVTHLSTTAETPAEISSNSPATTGFSTETTLPLSTRSTRDGPATLNPLETESSTSSSSSPVSKSDSQASEQTASNAVSGHSSTVTRNGRTEETSSTPSATVTESSLGITSTKGALSPVTSELNTQEDITTSSNQRTLNDVTARDRSHSSLHSTAAEIPSTDRETSALSVSTGILDSSTVAPTATSHFTTNNPPQTEVSLITGSSNTVPKTVPMGSTRSDTTDTESNSPPALTNKVSSTASAAAELGDKSTTFVGTNPVTHLSTTGETPAEISSNSPATTGFSTETTLPLSTRSTRDGPATLNPLETESSTSSSSSPVSKSDSQASEQTASNAVSGHGSTVTRNGRTEETSSTPSATVTESSSGITSTKGALSPVTSELNTQEDITTSSNQRTLNDVTARDRSHSSLHSTAAEILSTDRETSVLPVSIVVLDSSTVAPTDTSLLTTNIPPQTEVSLITGSSNTVPKTVPMGSTRSDTTDTESNSPPALTNKVSSTASAAAELGDKSTTFVGTNPVTHLSTTAETPAEISSNSPATTGFSTETTLPLSTRSTRDGPATLNPLETESSTSSSSSPVSKSDSQASEQTASNAVSGHSSTVTRNGRTEETSSTPSATVTRSSLGITSTKGALSPVTSESNTEENITTSFKQRTVNDVTARDRSHSSLHSTAAETPRRDTEMSALPESTVTLESNTVAQSTKSRLTTNIPPQTEVSHITGSSNTVPKTVPMGSTRSDTTDTESNSPPALTNKVSSTASAAAELGDKSTTFVGTNPVTHLSTTGETPAEISSNSPATTGFSTETTLPLSTRSTRDGPATLNPLETESSTSSSSSPVSKSDSQASEQTASNAVSGHGSTVTRNGRTEETSSTPSATVTESSSGITSTKGALSPVTSELNTQEDITTSSNQRTLNDVTAGDRSHSSLHSTAAETPSTDRETSALPVSTVILDSSTMAPTATSHFTTNIPPQTEVSLITGSSNTVPKTVPMGSTRSDTTDTESNSPPALTNKVSSTASAAAEVGDKSTTFVGTNPVTHLSTTGETPAEISSNSPATTGFSTETTLPLSTRSTRDGPATLNPLETESSTSSSSSPVSKSDSQASEQTASNAVSGHGSTVTRNGRTEETSSTPSATVTESSLGITSTKGALSPVTSEVSTQGDITTSSNQRTLNDITARDRSHSSLHSTAAETPSTDRETSALPVSIVVLDSSTVAPTDTSLLTTNIPPQTEVSLITGSSNTVPKTVPMGSTRSDTTDTESNSPPALTNKVSSTASAAAELGDKSTTFVGTNPVTHLSTTAETPAEISSNSPATTGFSTETTLPLSTRSTRDGPATLNPLETESSTSSSSSPVSKSDSQASEQTASNAVSGHGSTVTRNGRTEEISFSPSATVTESSSGITSTKGALSPVTSELNTQEDITTSSNKRTLNDVTARDRSHSSLHSTAAETPSTDRETSALSVSTIILDSSTMAPTATSRLTTNIPPQTKDSLITGSSNTVPKTVPMGSTRSDTSDTESNSPPALTNKVSSTASAAAELGDKSTTFVGTNPVTHLSTTAETPAEISSNSPATTGFSTETTLPLSTRSTRDGPATLNPLETESSTSSSSSPVSKSDSQASEQTASNAVSGHSSTVTRNGRTEETSSTPSATVTESSLGITSTKGALSPVTSELNTQEDITTSSNQRTLNDVTAGDRSHSSLHSSAAEIPSTDRETSALPVSTVILDSSTVAPTATSHLTTNNSPQTKDSLITGSGNTVPKTVPMGSTRSDTTDTESNSPPALTNKVSSTASAAAELGDKSTTFVGTNPVTHLSTTGETPAEISSNSPATTGFSTETTLPLSTRSTRDGPATLNPLETESSTSSSSSPVSKSDSQASEQTASNAVSGHSSTVTRNGRTEETSSTPSATVTESSLGITSTKGALSPVTSELNTQEDITTSSNQRTLNDVTARDRSHSSLHSTAAETPSTDRETSALSVSTGILDSSTVAPTATSHFTTNNPPQTEVSLITGSSNTVPKTVPMGSTRSDTTDTESNSPPALTNKVSSTASAAAELGDKSTTFVGTNPVTHLSTTGETPAEISSNSPATTGFSTETTLPLSTRSTRDGPATLNPLETESSTSSSSSPVSKSDSQASEQTASNAVSGHGSTVTRNGRTEETSSTPSATVTESSLGITSTKGALSPVTSELNTQEDITSSSNKPTLNDVTARDRSHSSLHSTAAETPSTDRETSALSVSTGILDSSTVAPTATSHFTTNNPPQTEVSLITGSSNTVPKTVPMGSTRSDTTDTESNSPPALTNKVSSTASAAAELGDKSTTFVGTNPVTHLSTTAETPAEISSNSPATTGFSTETTLPLSTRSTRDGPATLNPLETESSTSSSSSPVSKSDSQASEQTASNAVSGHGSTVTRNGRTEETSSTPSATVTESSLGITSTKGALSPVTSELNTQEDITTSSNQRTLNDVTARDRSHSSLHSTAAETPSTDRETSALPVSTVILDSSIVAPTATSHLTTNIPPQTKDSLITGSSNTVPKTVPMGSTRSDTTDTESNSPPALTNKVSSTASAAAELGDKSTTFVGTNPVTHLSTTAETPAEISSNSPATTGFSTETTLPLSTRSTRDGPATLNPLETESSTSSSSSPVSKSDSQASEQTASNAVSGHSSTVTRNGRTDETSSTPSATVTESSSGITSTKDRAKNKQVKNKIRKNLPPEMQRLLDEGKMRIVINNLRSGSIVVDFMIVLDVGENLTKTELTAAFTEAFNNSTEFQTDGNGTLIEETNSCETGFNGCSEHATCNVSGSSYSCQCQAGFTDFSPNVPGRDCREPAGEPVTIAPSKQPSTSKPSVESISPTQESETAPATSINTTVPLPVLSPQSTSLIYPTTVNLTNLITSLITTTLQPTIEVTSTNTVSKVPTSNVTLISPTGNTIITSTEIDQSTPTEKTTPIYTDTIATTEKHFSTPAMTETRVTLPVSSSVATKATNTYSINNTSLETTPLGTIAMQSTAAPVSNAVLTNGTSRPSPATDTNDISTAPSTIISVDPTITPSPVSTTPLSLSSTASSTERISTGSSGTSATDTTRVTTIVELSTNSVSSTTRIPTTFSTIPVTTPYRSKTVTSQETFNRTTRSTVIVTGSTTNPILTTTSGACTSLDFSIQLENVTSDMIQFNWTPQGGGIAYTASLFGDEAVKKNTTYKTSIAYEHLLPGQEYIISVEVLNCGEKTSTSMTVQTASKNFKGQTRLIDKVFNPQYRNKSSAAFKDFEKNFTDEIGGKLTGEFKNLFDMRKLRIVIDSLSNGSVTVLFHMVMPVQQNLTRTTVFDALIKALNKSALGRVDFNSTFVEVGNICETVSKVCSEHASCIREEATYSCKCKDGFYDNSPRVPGRDCQDINECATNASSCSRLATCNNTVGSYECNCNPGIKDENPTNPGRQCKDPVLCFSSANLCSTQNNDCLDSKNRICSSKQAFACEILFKNLVFGPELYNSESQRYQNLSQSITTDVVKQMRISLRDDSFDIIVVGFRRGSVIAYFVSLLQGQQYIDANTLQANLSKIVKNVFGNETEVTVQSIPTSSETNLAWKTAVIVLGVLLGVALILALLILSVCLWMRSTAGEYWLEPKGLMGNFAYQYL